MSQAELSDPHREHHQALRDRIVELERERESWREQWRQADGLVTRYEEVLKLIMRPHYIPGGAKTLKQAQVLARRALQPDREVPIPTRSEEL